MRRTCDLVSRSIASLLRVSRPQYVICESSFQLNTLDHFNFFHHQYLLLPQTSPFPVITSLLIAALQWILQESEEEKVFPR